MTRANVARLAVMPGDGVGPEVVEGALAVLEAVAEIEGFEVSTTIYPHAVGYREADGSRISEQTIDEIGRHDALLFGAQGGPSDGSDVLTERPLVAIGNQLELSVGVRTARLYAPRLSPLRDTQTAVDILLVRDVSEDCFVGPGGAVHVGSDNEVTAGLLLYTREVVDRVLLYALQAAANRRGQVALVTQVEGVSAHRIWHRRLEAVTPVFPNVEVRALLPDTAASTLVDDPSSFDVIATTYWLGGILSNLMASIAGGTGLMPSGRINTSLPFGLFEPAHGTAPRHVGKGTVSPIAAIASLALLLEFIGERSAASRVEQAVANALSSGRVPDVTTRSGLSTTEVTGIVIDELGSAV